MRNKDFPDGFVWGAASCPARCEGETVSDWAKLSAPDGSVPDDGPRHWRRYRYDFRAMADLGLGAYRFGFDWGRLQRAPYAELNRADSYRYLEMLAELRGLGIEPWLVLFQDALPRWAAAEGGWLNPETPHWFADFARRVAHLTDGEVAHWISFHEPQIDALSRYAWDRFPGGTWGRLDQARAALRRMAEAHGLAAAEVRRRLPGCRVGLSLAGGGFFPSRLWHPGDWLAAGAVEWAINRYGLRGFLSGPGRCDFLMLGVGNELEVGARDALSLSSGVAPSVPGRMRHEGGGVGPERRRRRLAFWAGRYRLPVYLVGGPGAHGEGGPGELLSAYAGDARVAGFFYDPLLDQFDPEKGLASARGLLSVDFHDPDRRREVRPFARKYGRIAKSGRLRKEAEA